MAEYGKEKGGNEATVTEVKSADFAKNTFDGHKADLFINTGQLGGKQYLIRVAGASGKPTLIAIHL